MRKIKFYKIAVFILFALMIAACQQASDQTLSPTETMRALNEASKKKDVETIKKLISKETSELLEQSAKDQNSTVDALLRKDSGAPFQKLPEMRNEKITGDTATVEIKNTADENWESMPLVKENGVWKIALDKFLADMKRKMNEEMKQVPVNPPSAVNGTSAPTNPETKPSSNK